MKLFAIPVLAAAFFLQDKDLLVHFDMENHYQITFPSTWKLTAGKKSNLLQTKLDGPCDYYRENVKIVVQDLGATPMNIKEYERISRFQVLGMGADSSSFILRPTKLSGINGGECEWIFPNESIGDRKVNIKTRSQYILNDGKAYLIYYTAVSDQYDKYKAEADSISSSFTLTK